jgi:hypothetical protein
MRACLIDLGVLRPTVVFTPAENQLVQLIYTSLDQIKSSIIRPTTVADVWETVNMLVEKDIGLFKMLIRTIHTSVSGSVGKDGRTTNNKPLEVLVAIGTKILITLEMFKVDVLLLPQTPAIAAILEQTNFHLGTTDGALAGRVARIKRDSVEGILVGKRKA